jgi:hypothetical protein
MEVKVKLENGIYKVGNGITMDDKPEVGLLVIVNDEAFFSGFNTWIYDLESLDSVKLNEGEDLFEVLGVKYYSKL